MVCKKSSSSLVLFKGQWNDHNTDCLQPKMIPKCNTSDGDFDCSPVFEGVPLPISIIQAILAFIILLVSVFFNILLAMAIILYRRFLDKSLIVSVSILISNTAVSVFLNGGVFLTTVSQTWLLGYWGCQIFGVMAIGGSFSRWILVGLLSVDRFCRVFYPFRYARQEKKVLIGLLVGSWTASLVITGIYGGLGLAGFDLAYPGCSFGVYFPALSKVQKATIVITLFFTTITGAVLPCILYFAMYRKAKKLLKVQPVVVVSDQATKGEPTMVEFLKRNKKASITFFGLVITFIFFTSIVIVKILAKALLYSYDISPALRASILYILSTFYRCFVIADFAVILSNADVRKVLAKLKKTVMDNITAKSAITKHR